MGDTTTLSSEILQKHQEVTRKGNMMDREVPQGSSSSAPGQENPRTHRWTFLITLGYQDPAKQELFGTPVQRQDIRREVGVGL
jgi:hypothetical protein